MLQAIGLLTIGYTDFLEHFTHVLRNVFKEFADFLKDVIGFLKKFIDPLKHFTDVSKDVIHFLRDFIDVHMDF